MQSFLLKNEAIKCFKSPLSWVLLTPLLLPSFVIFLFVYTMPYEEFLQRIQSTSNDPNPYNYIYKWFQVIFNFILMPYYSILLIWFFEIERTGRCWSFIQSLPIKFTSIIYSKIFIVVCYVGVSIIISAISLVVIEFVLKTSKPEWPFNEYQMIDAKVLTIVFGGVYLVSLPSLLILFILIMLFDNPGLIIIGASFIGYVPLQLNPFQFHKHVIKSFWTLQLGGDITPSIYIQSIIISLVILTCIRYCSNRIFRTLARI